ncbi:aryl-alcohol dehydrogenase [Pseudohyphozyma bogoriensis]|nr:aryl-alcohol dehydrogenase [Pseudohyphozyma bogoriensis]
MSAEELPSKVGYVRLGQSGLKVSKIILGCMSYGQKQWQEWVLEEEESMAHFKAAWDMGVNTWDTANVYSNGESERIVGKAIKKFSIPLILTKVMFAVGKTPDVNTAVPDIESKGYVNLRGLSRKHIFDSIKASLERLQVDYVDVLQCHRFDYETPIEETMDALHDGMNHMVTKGCFLRRGPLLIYLLYYTVVKAGYARYIGMSACHAYQFHAMQNYAKSKGQTMFIAMQNHYNPCYREEEREMFPTTKLFGTGMIPFSPLARGYLARPFADQSTFRAQSDRSIGRFVGNPDSENINKAVEDVAKARGYTMAQVTLAWVLAQPGISAPIIGTTKIDSLKELVQATHIKLTDDEITAISAPYQPRALLGHS